MYQIEAHNQMMLGVGGPPLKHLWSVRACAEVRQHVIFFGHVVRGENGFWQGKSIFSPQFQPKWTKQSVAGIFRRLYTLPASPGFWGADGNALCAATNSVLGGKKREICRNRARQPAPPQGPVGPQQVAGAGLEVNIMLGVGGPPLKMSGRGRKKNFPICPSAGFEGGVSLKNDPPVRSRNPQTSPRRSFSTALVSFWRATSTPRPSF